MLKVYTAQYRYPGKDRLDITVKGQDAFGKIFAPSWRMVRDFKNGTMSEYEYERDYHAMMLGQFKLHRQIWIQLLAMDEVTLVCFCGPGEFCHRLLLAQYLEKLGAVHMGERGLTDDQQELPVVGDVLGMPNGIICQQVNCRGVMGAGIAKQIRDKWPQVYTTYRKEFEKGNLRVGKVLMTRIEKGTWFYGTMPIVANLCGQDRYGRDKRYTDYIGLRKAMLKLSEWRRSHLELTGDLLPIYFPYGMSCSLAGGDWYLVHCMIKNIFPDAVIVRRHI